jgi:hypothetical protein
MELAKTIMMKSYQLMHQGSHLSERPEITKQTKKENLQSIELLPSKLLTSSVTLNFDRGSQKIKKILGASRLKKGILSQKLLSLKYFSTCQKN